MRHPNADIAIEWFQDQSKVLEYRHHNADKWFIWTDDHAPDFDPAYDWRFRPEPTPDYVEYWWRPSHGDYPHTKLKTSSGANLKLTFDGETGKLKSAEVIGE